jgi:hypothetical protein
MRKVLEYVLGQPKIIKLTAPAGELVKKKRNPEARIPDPASGS